MTYRVKLPVFEGPFDLLLHLVKVNEMDIYDVPISQITAQYLDYVRMMQELDLELAGEFLVMAATLIQIKARMLLPRHEITDQRDEEIGEILSARELIQKLVEYRRFKEAAQGLRAAGEVASRVHYRTSIIPIVPEPADELSVDVGLLYKAFARVLRFVDVPAFQPELFERYTVEDKISFLTELAGREAEVDLTMLFRRCFDRAEIIVTFLATLELCRLKQIFIRQQQPFGGIVLVPAVAQGELAETAPEQEPTNA